MERRRAVESTPPWEYRGSEPGPELPFHSHSKCRHRSVLLRTSGRGADSSVGWLERDKDSLPSWDTSGPGTGDGGQCDRAGSRAPSRSPPGGEPSNGVCRQETLLHGAGKLDETNNSAQCILPVGGPCNSERTPSGGVTGPIRTTRVQPKCTDLDGTGTPVGWGLFLITRINEDRLKVI